MERLSSYAVDPVAAATCCLLITRGAFDVKAPVISEARRWVSRVRLMANGLQCGRAVSAAAMDRGVQKSENDRGGVVCCM